MKPYTYHLYHTPTNRHYYGARYKKDCSPNDLWTTYFTSSKIVHELIEQYGLDSFVVTIRKTFKTREETINWEARVLTRVDAQHNDQWINRHNGRDGFMGPHFHSEKTKEVLRKKSTGQTRSEETRAKMRESALRREAKRRVDGWIMPIEATTRSQTTRQERIANGSINPYSAERNNKMARSKRGTKRHYLPDGSFIMVKSS